MRVSQSVACLIAALLSILIPTLVAADDRAAGLDVNEAFYTAFRTSDMDKMSEIWGQEEPIAVQHPSTALIRGRKAVMESWALMMRVPPDITCAIEAVMQREDQWGVICNEQLNPGSVRMINIFHQEGSDWKMIYHGPAPKEALSS